MGGRHTLEKCARFFGFERNSAANPLAEPAVTLPGLPAGLGFGGLAVGRNADFNPNFLTISEFPGNLGHLDAVGAGGYRAPTNRGHPNAAS